MTPILPYADVVAGCKKPYIALQQQSGEEPLIICSMDPYTRIESTRKNKRHRRLRVVHCRGLTDLPSIDSATTAEDKDIAVPVKESELHRGPDAG
ncbi:hypothetical protein NDU88_008806 [Pleurodeles waltl]|uniref:Uncharacterized protein n=1 Tax=Pleurodeles waltl TaxID=8319 RepID=A0AAV7QST6_PLEWA|nr:hypothetical protein NDU88_008806 [Pleurodeles waltl]